MSRIIDRIIRGIEWIDLFLLVISVCIIVLQVFFRYVLRSPLSWTEQTARYLFVWMMMLGIPIIFNRNIILAFDLIVKQFPFKSRVIVGIIMKLLAEGFALFYFIYSMDLCIRTSGKIAPGIGIPITYVYAAQPTSAFLLFIVVLNQICTDIKLLIKGEGKE